MQCGLYVSFYIRPAFAMHLHVREKILLKGELDHFLPILLPSTFFFFMFPSLISEEDYDSCMMVKVSMPLLAQPTHT